MPATTAACMHPSAIGWCQTRACRRKVRSMPGAAACMHPSANRWCQTRARRRKVRSMPATAACMHPFAVFGVSKACASRRDLSGQWVLSAASSGQRGRSSQASCIGDACNCIYSAGRRAGGGTSA
jgi:hypothetical protein